MAVANSPPYVPNLPQVNPQSDDVRALQTFLMQELRNISDAMNDISRLQLNPISAPPPTPRDGLICLADGTNWNPLGDGEGTKRHLVVYIDGAWQQASLGTTSYISNLGSQVWTSNLSNKPAVTYVNATSDGNSTLIAFDKERGTLSAPTPVQVNDALMQMYFNGYQSGAFRSGGAIQAVVDAAPAGNVVPTRLVFFTTPVGGVGLDHAMILDGNGNLTTSGAIFPGTANNIQVGLGTTQSFANATTNRVNFDTKFIDPQNRFDAVTNHRYTTTMNGTFFMMAAAQIQSAANDINEAAIGIFKNGSIEFWGIDISLQTGSLNNAIVNVAALVPLTTSDYAEIWVYASTVGGGNYTVTGDTTRTYLTAIHL